MTTHLTRRLRVYLAALFAHSATVIAADRPNILWLVIENIGPDLGCYGYPLVKTPNLDRLASEGMRYELAFSTAPICSPSRSAFMTGMYQTAIGSHNHRGNRTPGSDDHFHLPAGVRPLTHRLGDAGYYTANIATLDGKTVGTGKTDLNFEVEGDALRPQDKLPANRERESVMHNFNNSIRLFRATDWAELKKHAPFYAQVNLPTVERNPKGWVASAENPWCGQGHPKRIDPEKVTVPPYYPDHAVTRKDWAGYLDAVCDADARAGEVLAKLDADGLADDTVVICFADNGRLEHRGHGWCYDSGDRVPLIIRWPRKFPAPPQYKAGTVNRQLISLIDLTATTLAIAGVPRPAGMQSQIFLGAQADPPRRFAFSARDRHDEAVSRIRAVRTERWRYIRNFMPEQTVMGLHRYKDACYPVVPLMRELHAQGKLSGPPLALMAARLPDEELYDLANDPFEIRNLAASADAEHQRVRGELRVALDQWIAETNDQGRIPEQPGVIEYWDKAMQKLFGTPASYPPPVVH